MKPPREETDMKMFHREVKNASLVLVASLVLLGLASCSASKPSSIEGKVMSGIKHHITMRGKNLKNPVADTKENLTDGQGHFGHHCQVCHGNDGQNTGVPFADAMSPPVADLAGKDAQSYTDGQLKTIIQDGIRPSGMPSWKGDLTDDEMWKIVLFIRHLPAKGSLGIPAIYKEDAEEHQNLQNMEQGQPHNHAGMDMDHDHGDNGKSSPPKKDESKPHTHSHAH